MLAGLLLRLAVSFWNGFFGPSLGAEQDASGLHVLAVELARGESTLEFRLTLTYTYFLAAVYWLIGPSAFVGGLMSCLAWLASAQLLYRSLQLLRASSSAQALAMLVYAGFPSSVLWTGVTMREPYQLLTVNLVIYCALKIGVARSRRHWLLLLPGIAVTATLHAALVVWSLVVALATALWEMVQSRVWLKPLRLATITAVLSVALIGASFAFTALFAYPLDKGLGAAVESYQRGGLIIGARTNYRHEVSIDSTADLVTFLPVSLLQYWFEPVPWRVSAAGDLPIVVENLLRLALLVQAVYFLFAVRGSQRGAMLLLLFTYVVLETTWSLGTFNWGTAIRHHLPGLGLLVLSAFAYARRPAADQLADERSKGPMPGIAAVIA